MPDYDPKSIPILDDIIEDEKKDTQGETPDDAIEIDTADDKIDQDDSTLDLFNSPAKDFTTADIDATELDTETEEPEIGSIDRFIEKADTDTEETEITESALIDYHPEEKEDNVDSFDHQEVQPDEFQSIEAQSVESFQPVTAPPVALETIVDDVVKQLLPDLEQQLRFLVQQALEEKLPAEMIEQISEGKND